MAKMNFGGVVENVVTREEFPLKKAQETLKEETIAIIGYGVQGPGQALNLKENGFNEKSKRRLVNRGAESLHVGNTRFNNV